MNATEGADDAVVAFNDTKADTQEDAGPFPDDAVGSDADDDGYGDDDFDAILAGDGVDASTVDDDRDLLSEELGDDLAPAGTRGFDAGEATDGEEDAYPAMEASNEVIDAGDESSGYGDELGAGVGYLEDPDDESDDGYGGYADDGFETGYEDAAGEQGNGEGPAASTDYDDDFDPDASDEVFQFHHVPGSKLSPTDSHGDESRISGMEDDDNSFMESPISPQSSMKSPNTTAASSGDSLWDAESQHLAKRPRGLNGGRIPSRSREASRTRAIPVSRSAPRKEKWPFQPLGTRTFSNFPIEKEKKRPGTRGLNTGNEESIVERMKRQIIAESKSKRRLRGNWSSTMSRFVSQAKRPGWAAPLVQDFSKPKVPNSKKLSRDLDSKADTSRSPAAELKARLDHIQSLTTQHACSSTPDHVLALIKLSRYWFLQHNLREALRVALVAKTTIASIISHDHSRVLSRLRTERLELPGGQGKPTHVQLARQRRYDEIHAADTERMGAALALEARVDRVVNAVVDARVRAFGVDSVGGRCVVERAASFNSADSLYKEILSEGHGMNRGIDRGDADGDGSVRGSETGGSGPSLRDGSRGGSNAGVGDREWMGSENGGADGGWRGSDNGGTYGSRRGSGAIGGSDSRWDSAASGGGAGRSRGLSDAGSDPRGRASVMSERGRSGASSRHTVASAEGRAGSISGSKAASQNSMLDERPGSTRTSARASRGRENAFWDCDRTSGNASRVEGVVGTDGAEYSDARSSFRSAEPMTASEYLADSTSYEFVSAPQEEPYGFLRDFLPRADDDSTGGGEETPRGRRSIASHGSRREPSDGGTRDLPTPPRLPTFGEHGPEILKMGVGSEFKLSSSRQSMGPAFTSMRDDDDGGSHGMHGGGDDGDTGPVVADEPWPSGAEQGFYVEPTSGNQGNLIEDMDFSMFDTPRTRTPRPEYSGF
ncbi:hypothetical protein HK101_005570 [Irineochytrium annulatum]|nr:hypothetical protein HK101_005570 [Irineochytrium annulatum]